MCPSCLSKQVRKSHLRWRDLPLLLLLRAPPSRCMICYRRFYAWPWLEVSGAPAAHVHGRGLLSRWSPEGYRSRDHRATTVH